MRNYDVAIYFVDNFLKIYHRKSDEVYTLKLKNRVLKNGRVAKQKKFLDEIMNIREIRPSLNHTRVLIIVNGSLTLCDKEIIHSCFEYIGYRDIQIIDEQKLIKNKENNIFLCVNKEYVVLYTKDCVLINYEQFWTDKKYEILKLLQNYSKYKEVGKIYVYGLGKDLTNLCKILEKALKIPSFYFSDSKNYILNKLRTN